MISYISPPRIQERDLKDEALKHAFWRGVFEIVELPELIYRGLKKQSLTVPIKRANVEDEGFLSPPVHRRVAVPTLAMH